MRATCHCGAVTITAPRPDDAINECQCGVCSRYGAAWAYYNPEQPSITNEEGTSTRVYSWGKKNIEFHFCELCNGLMYWWPTDEERLPKMGVNTRIVAEKHDLEGIEVIKGAPVEKHKS